MKRLLLLLLFPLHALAQKEEIDTLQFNFIGVELVDSVPAKVLQSRARLFISENYKSAKDVVQMDDADAGIILAKGNFQPVIKQILIGRSAYGWVNFSLKIQVKDGKYKYTFSDFYHDGDRRTVDGGSLSNMKPACGTFYMSKDYWRQIKLSTQDHVLAFIEALKVKMKSGEIAASKDNF